MANEKDAKAGNGDPVGTGQPTEKPDTLGDRIAKAVVGAIEQLKDTTGAPPPSGDKRVEGPPRFEKPVRVGDTTFASPIAASVMARYDDKETAPQPGEFWSYRDRRYNRRGYI